MEIKAKIVLTLDGEMVFGKGRADLLEAIDAAGSISAAARELNMSYRHAWALLQTSEHRLGYPLLDRAKGGPRGGGARLTGQARALLKQFRAIEAAFLVLARKQQRMFSRKP